MNVTRHLQRLPQWREIALFCVLFGISVILLAVAEGGDRTAVVGYAAAGVVVGTLNTAVSHFTRVGAYFESLENLWLKAVSGGGIGALIGIGLEILALPNWVVASFLTGATLAIAVFGLGLRVRHGGSETHQQSVENPPTTDSNGG